MSLPAAPVVASSPDAQRAMLASHDPGLAANKRLVWDFWRTFIQGGDLDAADRFLAAGYVQHNPLAPGGRDGAVEFFRALGISRTEPSDHIDGLVAIVAERDLVTLALRSERVGEDGEPYTTTWFDMFRVSEGAIVEHWDCATTV